MRRDILVGVVFVAIIAVMLIIYSLFFTGSPAAEITSVTTDSDVYHSKGIMTITISISSSGELDNMTIGLEGIRNRDGDTLLSHQIPVNLSWGPNTYFYEYELPRCSSCSGLNPGDYDINVVISRNGDVMDKTNLSVRIEQ